jgi:hypothetical protein
MEMTASMNSSIVDGASSDTRLLRITHKFSIRLRSEDLLGQSGNVLHYILRYSKVLAFVSVDGPSCIEIKENGS